MYSYSEQNLIFFRSPTNSKYFLSRAKVDTSLGGSNHYRYSGYMHQNTTHRVYIHCWLLVCMVGNTSYLMILTHDIAPASVLHIYPLT